MRPIGQTAATDQCSEQTNVATGRERDGEPLEEKREVNNDENTKGTEEKLLDLLTGLGERMERLEESQRRPDKNE